VIARSPFIQESNMSKVSVRREHDLDQQDSKELAEKLLNKLVDKFGGKFSEDSDSYRYKHTAGINAVVEPNEGEFVIDVKLGFMARSLGPTLEGHINKVLDEYLA